jgi:steroid 5-alpha reductase family enzyme
MPLPATNLTLAMAVAQDVATLGFFLTAIHFTMMFGIGKSLKNMAVVDAYWGFAPAVMVLCYGVGNWSWFQAPAWVYTAMVCFSSLRLGWYLLERFLKHYPDEDIRYARMRELWTKNTLFMFFGAYMLQGLLLWILTLPAIQLTYGVAFGFASGEWQWMHTVGIVIWVISWWGEAFADGQLKAFKQRQPASSAVCKEGLWRYSRHPNYFFQWLQWVAYAVYFIGSPFGWLAWFAPVLMGFFINAVTGVAITEEMALKRKGEAYRQYQQETSAFFPWFPKTVG